ncbi:hypothetical protein [Altericroceibacterium endophyticum]|uniref:Uncharacterized protein n=1 Tax=Altericroceibacterium endophyticum TaxID=1808508 RepID=A0A6I4T0Z0_9SPHN|nr:hypothetical protein [Altericroceibacterium endophyticum]MXO64586.1 hypothetical protein [Altericroceibacterium endophyticum]
MTDGVDALAAGGLVGEEGVAGTGLLANTGDPENTNPVVSGVLVATGETVTTVADGTSQIATLVDGALPGGETSIVGRVVSTVDRTGQALVDTGNGQAYLVDGLTAAPGDTVSIALGEATIGEPTNDSLIGVSALSNSQPDASLASVGVASGAESDSALLGVSALSESQNDGQLLTAGVASNGEFLTLESPALQQGESNALSNTVNGVTDTVNDVASGLTQGASSGDGLSNTLDGVTNGLEGAGSGGSGNALGDTVQGVTDGVGNTVEGLTGGSSNGGLVGGLLGGGQ